MGDWLHKALELSRTETRRQRVAGRKNTHRLLPIFATGKSCQFPRISGPTSTSPERIAVSNRYLLAAICEITVGGRGDKDL
jgi:hypothetical protein